MSGTVTELKIAMQQMLDGKIEGPALLRRLVSHNGWRIPIEIDGDGNRRPVFVKDTKDQRFQLLFTDEPSYQAGAKVIGAAIMGEKYVEMKGVDLFASLSDESDVAAVNWGAPPEIFFKQAQ